MAKTCAAQSLGEDEGMREATSSKSTQQFGGLPCRFEKRESGVSNVIPSGSGS